MSRLTILPNKNKFRFTVSEELFLQSVTDGRTETITMSLRQRAACDHWPKTRLIYSGNTIILLFLSTFMLHMYLNNYAQPIFHIELLLIQVRSFRI
jgi:hypothetical protein